MEELIKTKGEIPYILKAPLSANGKQVKIINTLEDLEKEKDWVEEKTPLAQKYLLKPLLLDGYKFTLRVYVVVTGYDPFRVYCFPQGLARICSQKYDTSKESLRNVFAHIDSYDMNQSNESEFNKNVSEGLNNDGLRW